VGEGRFFSLRLGRGTSISALRVKSSGVIRFAVFVFVLAGLAGWWVVSRQPESPPLAQPAARGGPQPVPPVPTSTTGGGGAAKTTVAPKSALSAAEKQARVEQIKKDYTELRAKAAAEFAAAKGNFPGGLNAFLRQLALLEREMHNDFAAFLEPRELEDLEMRDTTAGQLVQRVLGDTTATEEQRREAFRLHRGFENQFALTFDLTPPALLARERERLATQEKIHAALGDQLFGSWLRGEGPEFGQMSEFVARHGLSQDAALNLWRARNELTLRRLELAAQATLTGDALRQAQEVVTRQAEARILAILGAGALESARREALGWLPRK
jgi:hypothetical protein